MKLLRIFTSLTGVSLALGLMLALHLPAQTPEQPPASAVEQTEPTDTPKPEAEDVEQGLREVEPTSPGRSLRYHDERVGIGSDVLHEEGDSAGTVVAIFADAIVDGEVENETVTILGDLTINGRARGETVNVLGHLTII